MLYFYFRVSVHTVFILIKFDYRRKVKQNKAKQSNRKSVHLLRTLRVSKGITSGYCYRVHGLHATSSFNVLPGLQYWMFWTDTCWPTWLKLLMVKWYSYIYLYLFFFFGTVLILLTMASVVAEQPHFAFSHRVSFTIQLTSTVRICMTHWTHFVKFE